MRVAAIALPFDVVSGRQRREQIESYLGEAAAAGADLALLPEYCFFQRTQEGIAAQDSGAGFHAWAEALPAGGELFAGIAAQAERSGMCIAYGGLEPAADGRCYNTTVVVDGAGRCCGAHRKCIMAANEFEDPQFARGDALEPIESPLGTLGVITCYEIYFPEIARVLELAGADCFLYPHADNDRVSRLSAQSRSRDHVMPLLCAPYASNGGAYVLDAEGEVIAEAAGPGVVMAELDLQQRVRRKYVWNGEEEVDLRQARRYQRRPELFAAIAAPHDEAHPLRRARGSA